MNAFRRSPVLLLLAPLSLLVVSGCRRKTRTPEPASRMNVLLIVVDAMRADHLGCYGYRRATSPSIDELAQSGVLFADAMAQGTETASAVPSLLTGRRPGSDGMARRTVGGRRLAMAPPKTKPLAEVLREAGYETAAVSANPLVGELLGIDRGFDTFDYTSHQRDAWLVSTAHEVTSKASNWLAARSGRARPFFLYLHYLEPHNQYMPPSEFCVFGRPGYTPKDDWRNAAMNAVPDLLDGGRVTEDALAEHGLSLSDVRRLEDLYDGEILCADTAIGELIKELKRTGIYGNTMIILTADHGEAFLEHGYLEHGGSLYQEMLHVPLIMVVPGARGGRRVSELVEHVDVAQTVLEAAGLPPGKDFEGQSLYGLLTGAGTKTDDTGIAQIRGEQYWAVRSGPMKLIASPGRKELYDLSCDPGERHDLSSARPDEVRTMEQLLHRFPLGSGAGTTKASKPSERETRALKSLGYLR